MLVGPAVDRGGGEADFEGIAMRSDDFVFCRTGLDVEMQYERLSIPAVAGSGHFLNPTGARN